MEVIREYTVCDVCEIPYYSKKSTKKVTLSYEDKTLRFDCCYKCLHSQSSLKIVYTKCMVFMKRIFKL